MAMKADDATALGELLMSMASIAARDVALHIRAVPFLPAWLAVPIVVLELANILTGPEGTPLIGFLILMLVGLVLHMYVELRLGRGLSGDDLLMIVGSRWVWYGCLLLVTNVLAVMVSPVAFGLLDDVALLFCSLTEGVYIAEDLGDLGMPFAREIADGLRRRRRELVAKVVDDESIRIGADDQTRLSLQNVAHAVSRVALPGRTAPHGPDGTNDQSTPEER